MRRHLLLLTLCLSSCAGPQIRGVGPAAIDCAAPVLANQVGGLLQRVGEILRGGEPNWEGQLAALETSGVSAVACAVNKAIKGFAVPSTGTLSAGDREAAERGQLYLARRGVVIK